MINKNEPFKLNVNGHYSFDLHPSDLQELDTIDAEKGLRHVLYQGKAYQVEILESDYAGHQYVVRVNGSKYTIRIADQYEQLIARLGLSVGGHTKTNIIKAPMPGLVLNVMAEKGQAVQKGDPLLILEAMKMENVIKAADDGIIKAIKVEKGAAVDKGQLLIELE